MQYSLLPLFTMFQTDFKTRTCNLIGCQEAVKLVHDYLRLDVSLFCVKLPTLGNYNNNVYVISIKKTNQHVPGLPMELGSVLAHS